MRRFVFQVFNQLLPADFSCDFIPFVYVIAPINSAALFRDLGFDSVHIIGHIHPIGNPPFMTVFHNQILVEETEGLLRGCSGQSYDKGIKVIKNLSPEIVNGAVAFIGNNKIEVFYGYLRIVGDLSLFLFQWGKLENRLLLQFSVKIRLTFKHRIKPLYGGNAHPAYRIKGIGCKVLDIVEFCKLSPVIRGYILLELPS